MKITSKAKKNHTLNHWSSSWSYSDEKRSLSEPLIATSSLTCSQGHQWTVNAYSVRWTSASVIQGSEPVQHYLRRCFSWKSTLPVGTWCRWVKQWWDQQTTSQLRRMLLRTMWIKLMMVRAATLEGAVKQGSARNLSLDKITAPCWTSINVSTIVSIINIKQNDVRVNIISINFNTIRESNVI